MKHEDVLLTLRAPRGEVENDPPMFSSVVLARGMILKQNFGCLNFNYFQVGGKIRLCPKFWWGRGATMRELMEICYKT